MDSWRWPEEANDLPASLWSAVRSLPDLGTSPRPSGRVLDFDLQSWPPSCPDWWIEPPLTAAYPSNEAGPVMNENVLYQPCITSWRIVLFHPTNSSLSQRLISYGHDSVSNYDLIANQSTPRRGGTWPAAPHTHNPGTAVSVISRYFSLSLRDPGKLSSSGIGVTLRTEASIGDRCSILEYSHQRGGIIQTAFSHKSQVEAWDWDLINIGSI